MATAFPFPFPSMFGAGGGGGETPTPIPVPSAWDIVSVPRAGTQHIVHQRQAVSIHTRSGIKIVDFLPEDMTELDWTRELRDTSRCTVTLPPFPQSEALEECPWEHWASVWGENAMGRESTLLWTGPLQNVRTNRARAQVTAADASSFYAKTRVPMSKSWDGTYPGKVAAELWEQIIELHGLGIKQMYLPDPEGEPFTFAVVDDDSDLSKVFSDLVRLGLRWTIVCGVPILGPAPTRSIFSLTHDDFLGDGLELVRDGTQSANDIVVRNANAKSRKRYKMGSLNLQALVTLDDTQGVSNAERSTAEYARHLSRIHDSITMSGATELRPEAPVSIEQLIPSVRGDIFAYNRLTTMELESVEVNLSDGRATVSVDMEAVVDLTELEELSADGKHNS